MEKRMISMEITKDHAIKLAAMCRETGMTRSALLRLLIDRSELVPRYSVRVEPVEVEPCSTP